MDICLEELLKKRFDGESCNHWTHVPSKIIVGWSDCESTSAAISARWMHDTWTSASMFKSWTGFLPSTSRSGATEILKAANGKIQDIDNVPTDGFKLVCRDSDELEDRTGCGMLLPNCDIAQPFKQGYREYKDAIVEVEDPRGWTFYMTVAQLVSLRSTYDKPLIGLDIPGPLVYVFTKYGFTVDFPDGKIAKNAMKDEDILATKQAVVKTRKDFKPILGTIYVRDGVRLMSLGYTPKLNMSRKHVESVLDQHLVNTMEKVMSTAYEKKCNGMSGYCKTLLKQLMTNAVQWMKKGNAYALFPWQDEDYVKAINSMKEQLDTNNLCTFVRLGEVRTTKYMKMENTIRLDRDPYDLAVFGREADIVNGLRYDNVNMFRGSFLDYDLDETFLKQMANKDASDLSLMPKSKDNKLLAWERCTAYESTYKYADVTADCMLVAVDKRVAWLKKVINTFESVFPTKEPNKTIEEWAAEMDILLDGNIRMLRILMPWMVKKMSKEGCFLV